MAVLVSRDVLREFEEAANSSPPCGGCFHDKAMEI
jgi:hypothetical protein